MNKGENMPAFFVWCRASDFFKISGLKWPMEQKMEGHFLKWWAQAYQTNYSWHLGCRLYLHTDTDTCMHICILTADYTVIPVLSGHSKKKTSYRLIQVIKLPFVIKIFVLSFLSGCLRHVLLYWLPTCTFCFAVRWIFLLKWDFFTTKKDGSTGPTTLESDGPYFEIMGQWPGPTITLKACWCNWIYQICQQAIYA